LLVFELSGVYTRLGKCKVKSLPAAVGFFGAHFFIRESARMDANIFYSRKFAPIRG
jgi:hypothetical protein